jgi:hypothetical protein
MAIPTIDVVENFAGTGQAVTFKQTPHLDKQTGEPSFWILNLFVGELPIPLIEIQGVPLSQRKDGYWLPTDDARKQEKWTKIATSKEIVKQVLDVTDRAKRIAQIAEQKLRSMSRDPIPVSLLDSATFINAALKLFSVKARCTLLLPTPDGAAAMAYIQPTGE